MISRNFSAPGCQWAFRTSSKLRRHERSHQNDRRHQCSQCNKAYIRLEHLREHFEVVHKNQKLACPFDNCEARFTQRPALVAHVKKHQDDPDSSRYSDSNDPSNVEISGAKILIIWMFEALDNQFNVKSILTKFS